LVSEHIDDNTSYTEGTIGNLSMLSNTTMVMGSRDSIQSTREGFTFTDKAVAIPMPRYSMLLLEGVARNEVYHCVPYVTLPRISHTYRKMRDSVAARHTLEASRVGAE